MNYYAPRQRTSDHRWDYTCMNDGRIWAVGYCHGWRPFTERDLQMLFANDAAWMARETAKLEPFREKYHEDGHTTEAEARTCYRTYLLDHRLSFEEDAPDATTLHKCDAPSCDTFTSGSARVNGLERYHLCAAHRTRDIVEQLYPNVGTRISS